MGTTLQDSKYALRMLVKNPGFAAVAVLTLALGIGANTAIFSVVDAALLRPLPFPQPQRIFAVHQSMPEKGIPRTGASYPNFLDWTRQNQSFQKLAAMRDTTMALSGQGEAIFVETAGVTGGYFGVFEQNASLGRTLQETDDLPSADAVVVLGAQPTDVLKLIFGKGLLIVGIGLAVGLAAAFGAARLAGNFIAVSPTDPVTYFAVSGLLLFVALVACYIPARRAMRVDPMVALRYE